MDIFIDFTKDYSEARALEDNEMIHTQIMGQAMNVFDRLYNQSKVFSEDPCKELCQMHNAISVFGSRGAGKSSFMYSMIKRIEAQYKDALCLPPIDPSHIEMKQHPFVNVLASIHQAIDKEVNDRSKGFSSALDIEMRQENIRLEKPVLRGLKTIDGIGRDNLYEEWNDDDYISLQGIEQAQDCNSLESSFHKYVRQSLRMIGKKCIVISFDDIDIDFKKGFEILEMIRKYLTSPQIITIITGDQSLYTALVRKYQWQFFDREYILKEARYAENHPAEFSSMVDHLENQYMSKVLKPENRISLLTIREYLNLRDLQIIVRDANGKTESLVECYKGMLKELGAQSVSIEELALFITSLSLRAQIRILTLRKMSLEIKETEEARKYLTGGLMSIFSTDIYQKSDNAKELITGRNTYTIEMLRLLVHSDTLFTSCNFMPQTKDLILNKALLAVGIKFDDYLRHDNYLIFDYWARVCYTQVLAEKLGGKTDAKKLKKLMEFSRMNTETGICKSVGLSEAYFQGQSYRKGGMVMPGCIYIGNSVPAQLAEKNEFLPLIPMQGTVDAKNSETVIVSIYRLMAVLSEFVNQVKLHENDENWDAQTALIKLGQYRNYIEPASEIKNFDGSERTKDRPWSYLDGGGDLKKVENFLKKAKKWAVKDVTASVQKINRVFTRFYFTIIQMEEQRYLNLGTKLNDIILALINAAIVEDALEKNVKGINVNHIGDITQIFIENWRAMHYSKEKPKATYSLSRWLIECPLLQLYINPFVINLMTLDDTDDSVVLSSILQYDQWLTEQESLNEENKDVEKELDGLVKTLSSIKMIEQIKEKIAELNALNEKYNIVKDEDEEAAQKLKEEIDEKTKVVAAFQSMTLITAVDADNERYATMYTDEEELYDMKDEVQAQIYHFAQKKQTLEQRIKNITEKINGVASFVMADYNKAKDKLNNFSIYPQYCTIKLSEIE